VRSKKKKERKREEYAYGRFLLKELKCPAQQICGGKNKFLCILRSAYFVRTEEYLTYA